MEITIIGPRSIGKTTIGKILAKKLNLSYISSDEEMDKKFKNKGGIKAVFLRKNKNLLFERSEEVFKEVFSKNNFVFDLAGGSLIVEDLNGNKKDFFIVKNNSIFIGLLPFEDDEKSIDLLKGRERTRKHWSSLSNEELHQKTVNYYLRVKEEILKHVEKIIYVEYMSPEEITDKIINLIKNKYIK